MRVVWSFFLFAGAAAAVMVGCGNPTGLEAVFDNTIDTLTMYALDGTPVSYPSGYLMSTGLTVRTDQSPLGFDFAFNIDSTGRAVLLPTGAIKLGRASGIQTSKLAFDSIKFAPTSGYQMDSAVVVDSNTVVIIQSRPASPSCPSGVPGDWYAKLQVLNIDTSSATGGRSLRFRILDDKNCGFRGLQLGLPRG